MKILIVEDNVDAADMLAALLEIEGHTVRTATSGSQALAQLRTLCADAVLCDVGLPDMTGYELARTIRNEPGIAHVPLVALTGHGRDEDRQRSAEAGFDEHLVKPADHRALGAALQRLTARV